MKWLARNGWILSSAILAAVLAALVINYVEDAETRRIVTESPCQIDAASRECQSIRREAEKAESDRTNCLSFKQANYPCPRKTKGSERDGKQKSAGAESGGGRAGGDPVDIRGDGPSPGGGSSPAPSDPGGSPPPPPAPTPIPPSPPGPAPQPPPRNPPSVGGGVDKVVEGLGETVSGAKGTVCDVAAVCLP